MEKYDNIVKSAEIRKLTDNDQYEKALMILDTMDLNKVKILTDLSTFAEVYTQMGRYQEAMKLLLRIREKSNSRRIIYQLIKLSIRMNDIESAEEYYEEYVEVAPKDSDKFILRYRIDRMKGEDILVMIETLEALKEYDYIEKWAYELAKLYHKAGLKDKCVRECSDIILWFGEGIIVEKAKLLKEHYVGPPKHINTFRAEDRKEIIEKESLTKTKDLAQISNEISAILDQEMKIYDIGKEKIEEKKKAINEILEKEEVMELEDFKEIDEGIEEITDEEVEKIADEEVEEITDEEVEEIADEEVEEIADEEVEEITDETVEEIPQEMEIVEDDGEILRGLQHSQEIKGIFKNILEISKISKQICSCLHKMQEGDSTRLFFVTGGEQSGKSTLSTMISGALFKMELVKTCQIAKINASKLNQINILDQKERLKYGTVIIEQAGLLETKTVQQIIDLSHQLKENIVFFFEDEDDNIEKIRNKIFEVIKDGYFKIQIPVYEKEDLKMIALDFVESEEYGIDIEGLLELEKMIADIVQVGKEDQRLGSMIGKLKRVKEKADQRNMANLLKVVNTGNYEQSELDRLKACDFQIE